MRSADLLYLGNVSWCLIVLINSIVYYVVYVSVSQLNTTPRSASEKLLFSDDERAFTLERLT